MPRIKVEPIGRDVEVIVSETLSPEARSHAIASFAREELSEAQAVNHAVMGQVPDHETFVDGRKDAPLDSVRPDNGVIVFAFDVVADLLAWIGAQLVLHSPARSGRYSRSHAFFADGVEYEPGAMVPPAEEYVFVSTQPYARKIERGLSPQAPDGVYEGVALLAKRRFGNAAKINYAFRAPLTGAILDWAQGRNLGSTGRSRRQMHRDVRNPAIVIRMR